MQKAIFLDRDGILNVDHGYVCKPSDFIFVDGIVDLLTHLKKKGYIFIIVTDQSGIARGNYTENDMHAFNAHMEKEYKKHDISFEKIIYCPHHPDYIEGKKISHKPCNCRKPSPKMWQMAKVEFDIDMSKSWTIGDKITDCQGGKAAGTKTILLKSKYTKEKPNDSSVDYFVDSLKDIVNIINK
jgi:D-glycero-D-manno-heptose 1,7-bisphosphate phosphatase